MMADKFSGLKRLCVEAKANDVEEVWIAYPWVLGDNYDEIIANLQMIAEANLALRIVGEEKALTGPTAGG